ncbi:MAG: xaa-pro aminopeptidase [Phycisphaerae bacterium]|nr:xaa-pro aminopeptidase [Phycisphaerae bacterium]MBM90309.1 xaa-pro aminopeptidase [Phycisphaerae bacterium]
MDTAIKVSEYQARRKKVSTALKGSVGLVFAGAGSPPLRGEWFPDMDFRYLTGISDEPGAVVLFDPTNPNPKRRTILFLKPVNPEMDVWDGYRDHISQELRDRYGFDTVMRTMALPRFLTEGARRTKKLSCLHPTAAYTQPLTPDLEIFQKVASRMPGCSIVDQSEVITSLRLVKSPAEIKQINAAIKATHNGLNRLMAKLKPGVGERDLHNALVGGFAEAGSVRNAFDPIVGSGHNATVLHYKENNGVCNDGDLIVVDSGAEINGYASDITRVFPANGKFTKEQAKLYNIVLKSQIAAIKAVKPGATMAQVDEASRKVIRDAGYGDQYLHGVGHHLGLETHDPSPDVKLKPGMVVTIEPGIYLQDKSIGIRIEDDILVTEKGNRNLSSMIPKTVAQVEAAIKAAQ